MYDFEGALLVIGVSYLGVRPLSETQQPGQEEEKEQQQLDRLNDVGCQTLDVQRFEFRERARHL